MVQVKIFEDGKEIHCNDSDLLVFAGFKEAGGATETNFGVVGSRVNKWLLSMHCPKLFRQQSKKFLTVK